MWMYTQCYRVWTYTVLLSVSERMYTMLICLWVNILQRATMCVNMLVLLCVNMCTQGYCVRVNIWTQCHSVGERENRHTQCYCMCKRERVRVNMYTLLVCVRENICTWCYFVCECERENIYIHCHLYIVCVCVVFCVLLADSTHCCG